MGGAFIKGDIIMPRKKVKDVRTIDVTGMSVSDIMDIDIQTFNRLREKDLRAITSRLVSAGNKRIRRLEKNQVISPALQSLGTDRRFSTKLPKGVGKEQRVNALRQEFSSARQFLSMKTSTMKGYNQYIKELKQDIAESTGMSYKEIKNVNMGKVFETLHKLQERGTIPSYTGAKGGSKGSIHARDYIVEQMVNNPEESMDVLLTKTEEDYNEYYEEQETGEIEI